MPQVTLTLTSGKTLTLDAEPGELVSALQSQAPAYTIARPDGSRTILNMRNVVALDYSVELFVQPELEEVKSDTAPADAESHTVAELKAALDKAGIEYDAKAVKAELVKLVEEKGLTV